MSVEGVEDSLSCWGLVSLGLTWGFWVSTWVGRHKGSGGSSTQIGVGAVEVVQGGVSAAASAAATTIAPIDVLVDSLMVSVIISANTHSLCSSSCLLLCFSIGPTWGVCVVLKIGGRGGLYSPSTALFRNFF